MAAGPTKPHATEPSEGNVNGPLSPAEVNDTADTAVKAEASDLSGKRVRAIPPMNANTVIVSEADFESVGIKNTTVTWDFRVDQYTVPVSENGLTEKAADYLTKTHPLSFEYINN